MEAEIQVLGACLQSSKAIETCEAILTDDDFYYKETHGRLFAEMVKMHQDEALVDPVTVMGRNSAWSALVHELVAVTPATANVVHYAQLVKDASLQREQIRWLTRSLDKAYNGEPIPELQTETSDLEIVSLHHLMQDFSAELENPPDFDQQGVDTPFAALERFMPGRVYILAGWMGDGKTAISVQFVEAAAMEKKSVGYFTIEMSRYDLRDRIITSRGIPYAQVLRRRVSDFHQFRLKQALGDLAVWNVDIIDDPSITVPDIRRVQRKKKYDYIVIDHLHRFGYEDRRDLEKIVRGIVNLAKEAQVPILLLAQLKRPFGTDKATRPTMSMLRESGMIEAEAAWIGFVYRKRDEFNNPTEDAELIVAKNRFGRPLVHPLHFDPNNVRFTEVNPLAA